MSNPSFCKSCERPDNHVAIYGDVLKMMTADEVFNEVKSIPHLLHVRKDVHAGAAFLHFSTYIWANDYQEEHEMSGLVVKEKLCGLKKPHRKLRTGPLPPNPAPAPAPFPLLPPLQSLPPAPESLLSRSTQPSTSSQSSDWKRHFEDGLLLLEVEYGLKKDRLDILENDLRRGLAQGTAIIEELNDLGRTILLARETLESARRQ